MRVLSQPLFFEGQNSGQRIAQRWEGFIVGAESPLGGEPVFYYGGQAIIEGVLMRGKGHVAMAVRRPTGDIALRVEPLGAWGTSSARSIPFVRGIMVLGDALVLGMRALHYSANVALEEEERELGRLEMGLILGIALAGVAAIFFAGPALAAGWLENYVPSSLVSNLLEGLIRLALLILYLAAIGRMKDIQRVFAYHGAEHKTIHAFERGAPLTIAGVRPFPTAHPRCGTAFLLAVVVVSIFVFALLGPLPMWARLLSRVVLVPVIAAVSYEVIRLGASQGHHPALGWLTAPGLALQRLTTREPEDDQIEVAIHAFSALRATEASCETSA